MAAADSSAGTPALSTSWREWLASPQWQGRELVEAYDAIVIGSGYGGSVAALRLAQKGYRTLVLERGGEYLPGDFPNDFGMVPKSLRVNVPTEGLPFGRAGGLIEFHVGQGMVAITGNGLGGGSLINAGVAIEPDGEVFAQAAWPVAIRNGLSGGLAPFFARARGQLRAKAWSSDLPGEGGRLRKTVALERLAGTLEAPAIPLDLTIDGDACTRCGDCCSGCNVPGAKQTLAHTYLREALDTGLVRIVTHAEVYRFAPHVGPDAAFAWEVQAFATDAQQQFTATRELFCETQAAATHRLLRAPLLFVCAGTLGSTQLLQRSQARSEGRLAFSPRLGERVSGNGDSLSWLVDEPAPVGSTGRGEAGLREWSQAREGRPYAAEKIVGPTITAAVDLRRPSRGLEDRLLIQDGAVPRAIALLSRELLASARTLQQLDHWWFGKLGHAGAAHEDPLAASAAMAQQSQVLLTMGHDGSPARLVWLEGSDRTAPYLPAPNKLPTYQAQQRHFDKLGARHVHLPLWQMLPKTALDLMSGPTPEPTVTTVHPLGGCPMGDRPEDGVVDDLGRVWASEPGAPKAVLAAIETDSPGRDARLRPHRYKGLHVLDGAMIPTALGCNPLLTITALAERALDALPPNPRRSAPMIGRVRGRGQPVAQPSPDIPLDATLHEVLLAQDVRLHGPLARGLKRDVTVARLEADFSTPDLPSMLTRAGHELPVQATLWLETRDAGPAIYKSTDGKLHLLPAHWASSGISPLVSMLAQLVLLGAWFFWTFAALLWHGPAWSAFGLRLVAWCALVVALPLPRAGITWAVIRGVRDALDTGKDRTFWQQVRWGRNLVLSMLKQLVHASEKRVMRYRVELQRDSVPEGVALPERLVLLASKRVVYRASIPEVLHWAWSAVRGRKTRIRDTFWEQVMDAQVRLVPAHPGGGVRTWARGRFRMGFDSLIGLGRAGTTGLRGPISLGCNGDTTTGLLAAAGYPLLFLRFALKTRMLDFRLPNYSGRPVQDTLLEPPALRLPESGTTGAELHRVTVARGECRSDNGEEPNGPLHLPLWRYRQRDAHGQAVGCHVQAGSWNSLPVARAKAVLLLHAFGQSGLTYTFQTTPQNLAERFLAEGYEVWVLEMRMSTRSGYGAEPCTVDQIGAHDIPATVDHILRCLQAEHAGGPLADRPWQIAAFAHCIGSASLWLALLSGKLSHGRSLPEAHDGPRLSKLSQLMSSQLHPWVVGGRGAQAKTWVPALLSKVWRRAAVPFAVRGEQSGLLGPLLDRLFGSLPAPCQEDRRPNGAGHDDAAATCRRIRYIDAELFDHRHIGEGTLAIMNQLFGDANLRLFAQARRFIERRRLVDEDGINSYVTDANIGRHLAFPIQLLHGEDNQLFDVAGAERTFERLGQHHGRWQATFCRDRDGGPGYLRIPGYGHLDGLIGDAAHADVFPHVVRFFRIAHDTADHGEPTSAVASWSLRAPRVGPLVGWTRLEGDHLVVRVSFMPEDGGWAGHPVVRLRHLSKVTGRFVTWQGATRWQVQDQPAARMAWSDIRLPADATPPEHWQLLVFTRTRSQGEGPAEGPDAPDTLLDDYIGQMNQADAMEETLPPLVAAEHGMWRTEFRLRPVVFETLPAGRDVTFAAASCRHPGLGVDQRRIDGSVRRFLDGPLREQVAFATLLGDQIYADATAGLVDPLSPVERFHERHETAFARGRLGDLLAALPVYMTPDDHEWSDNYPLASPLAKRPWPRWTDPALPFGREDKVVFDLAAAAVTAFQRLQSPTGAGCPDHYAFTHGCARVFAIDSRLHRRRNQPSVVPDLAGLEAWLAMPEAQHALNVVMCGSVVLPGLQPGADPASPGAPDTWQHAPEQRQALLRLLVTHARGRFLLLSGDYHVSGAAVVTLDGEPVGAAIVAPPLYAPLVYANSPPASVFVDEAVDLGDGRTLRMRVPPGGEFAPGSGMGFVSVRRQAQGVAITYQRKLWVWERGSAQDWTCDLGMPPDAAVRPRLAEAPADFVVQDCG